MRLQRPDILVDAAKGLSSIAALAVVVLACCRDVDLHLDVGRQRHRLRAGQLCSGHKDDRGRRAGPSEV
jgi:hypothetical protein